MGIVFWSSVAVALLIGVAFGIALDFFADSRRNEIAYLKDLIARMQGIATKQVAYIESIQSVARDRAIHDDLGMGGV